MRWLKPVLPAAAVATVLVLGACGTAGNAGSLGSNSSHGATGSTVATDGAVADTSDQNDPDGGSPAGDRRCGAVTRAEIQYARGTVAPPFHYEWTLSLVGTRATFTMRGGYDDTSAATWSRDFDLGRPAIADLCDAALRFGGDPGEGVGGDRSSYTIISQKPDDAAARLEGAIRSPGDFSDYVLANIVPEQVWAEVNAQFQAWSFAQQAERDDQDPIPAVVEGDPLAASDIPDGFCDGATSGRIAYSSKGPERVDRMELLLTFARGRAFLVVTPDFSGPYARWDVTWNLDQAQQQSLCALALSTLQDAPAGQPDPRSPGFDIVLTGADRTVTGAGLDLTGASAPFMAALWDIAGDDVTEQTFARWQRWVQEG